METTMVGLRYRTKDILSALQRNESVKILYHGKIKGVIVPQTVSVVRKAKEFPFFGMAKDVLLTVEEEMDRLRGPR